GRQADHPARRRAPREPRLRNGSSVVRDELLVREPGDGADRAVDRCKEQRRPVSGRRLRAAEAPRRESRATAAHQAGGDADGAIGEAGALHQRAAGRSVQATDVPLLTGSRKTGATGMRIAIMGSGGVGGYFGARLAQAGNDVAFIARGRHLAAMRANGLAIRSVLGDMTIPRPAVTDDPAGLAPADIVLFAVKLWDTEGAAKAVLPLLATGGVVVPFQNGVESIERIGAIVGADRVMGGVAYIAATIGEPGVIAHTGTMARLRFGPVEPSQRKTAEALL